MNKCFGQLIIDLSTTDGPNPAAAVQKVRDNTSRGIKTGRGPHPEDPEMHNQFTKMFR